MSVVVLIVASGTGDRFQSSVHPKQYTTLSGKAILLTTIERFLVSDVSFVQVVINSSHVQYYNEKVKSHINDFRLLPFVFGGSTRQKSVHIGLKSIAKLHPKFVIIHDGCRPFFPNGTINKLLYGLTEGYSGVIPVIPIDESVCNISGRDAIGYVGRENLRIVQTPQAFIYESIFNCHENAAENGVQFSDDGSMPLHHGLLLKTIDGDKRNLKVTTFRDVFFLRALNVL